MRTTRQRKLEIIRRAELGDSNRKRPPVTLGSMAHDAQSLRILSLHIASQTTED